MITELEAAIAARPNRRRFHYMRYFAEDGPWRSAERLLVGAKVVYNAVTRQKYIDQTVWPVGPLEPARPYLHAVWKANCSRTGMGAKRVPWRKEALPFLDIAPPNWFQAPRLDRDLAYVDIDAAYFSLYSRVTLDVTYRPGRCLSLGRLPFLALDELGPDKLLRNVLSGIFRSRTRHEYRRGQLLAFDEVSPTPEDPSCNRFLAPDLWGFMAHTLHAIAYDAVNTFGAHSWATDGGVFELEDADRFLTYLRNTWGLSGSIRAQGRGEVTGVTRWRIGRESCGGRWVRSLLQPIHGILNLDHPTRHHLRICAESPSLLPPIALF